jgi:hypothetical protein
VDICIVNQTTVVPSIESMVQAVARQLVHDVAPAWERVAPAVRVVADIASAPRGSDVIAVLDDADQAGALGYHATDPRGRPYGRVFAKTILDHGGTLDHGATSVSVALSHEAIELFLDAPCSEWGDRGDGEEVAWEACDPIQGDSYAASGTTIAVSNFVLPAYFNPGAPKPYDHLKLLKKPFSVAPKGYMIVRRADAPTQQFGPRLVFGDPPPPAWQAPMKLHPAARTARRLREA